jgi:hypothetical protein
MPLRTLEVLDSVSWMEPLPTRVWASGLAKRVFCKCATGRKFLTQHGWAT